MLPRAELLRLDPLAVAESLRPALGAALQRLLDALGREAAAREELRPELPARLQALHRWALWGYGADPTMDTAEGRTAALTWMRGLVLSLVADTATAFQPNPPAHGALAIVEAASARHQLTQPDAEVMLAIMGRLGGLSGPAMGDLMRHPAPVLHAYRRGDVWMIRARHAVLWLETRPDTGRWGPMSPEAA